MRSDRSTSIFNPAPNYFQRFDDRQPISSFDMFPYRSMGQIRVDLIGGECIVGQGTLVSDFTVLTSGSLFKNTNNDFLDIKRVCFIPPHSTQLPSYGVYDWLEIRACHTTQQDWALMGLVEPAGHSLGFLGTQGSLHAEERRSLVGLASMSLRFENSNTIEIEENLSISTWPSTEPKAIGMTRQTTVGAPLLRNWISNNPEVIGILSAPTSRVDQSSSRYCPTDYWGSWLSGEFGVRHKMDRFRDGFSKDGLDAVSRAMMPLIGPYTYLVPDDGPCVSYGGVNKLRVDARRPADGHAAAMFGL